MSQNSLNVSGMIEYVSWKPAGSQTRNGPSKWPRLSIRFSFQPVPVFLNGQQYMLDDQKIWVTLSTPQTNNQPDEGRIGQLQQGSQALLTDATFHLWGNPPKAEIKGNFHNLLTGNQVLARLNRCVVEGKVHSQNDQWLFLESSYSVPGHGQNRKPEWRSRIIPVYLQSPISVLPGNRRVLVFGALSGQTYVWDGQQYNKQEFVHIIAEEVHACL